MTHGLFDDEIPQDLIELGVFDYRLLSADTRVFVIEKTDETQWLLKKTAENIILIGKNLQAVKAKLPHGMFLPWLKYEFGLSQVTANNFMHVADRFDGKLTKFVNLSVSALYALASPSTPEEAVEEALHRADSGEKITHALAKQIIDAQEAAKKAQDDEAQARAAALISQQQLFNVQEEASAQIEALNGLIDALREEIKTIETPPVETREVITNVVPPEMARRIRDLEQQVERLQIERTSQLERIEKQEEDLKLAIERRERSDSADQMRKKWHMVTSEVTTSMMRLLAQWPSPVDLRSFEADEWMQLAYLKETLQRVLSECEGLHVASASSSPHLLRPLRVQSNGVEG
jgi:hypothetical protein